MTLQLSKVAQIQFLHTPDADNVLLGSGMSWHFFFMMEFINPETGREPCPSYDKVFFGLICLSERHGKTGGERSGDLFLVAWHLFLLASC